MGALIGRKVILVAPQFFGYDRIVENALRDAGADVFRVVDRPFSAPLLNAIAKLLTRLVALIIEQYYFKELDRHQGPADYVLVINGQTLSKKVIHYLRKKNPDARLILYMWDSIENRPSIKSVLGLYDDVYSFDPESAKRYNLRFRPLFYGPGDKNKSCEIKNRYLMTFIGTVHSDRYAILRSLSRNFSIPNCYWYMFLQARWLYWWKRLIDSAFKGSASKDFYYDAISSHEVQKVFESSDIIVDIEHPKQTGLTIRTFDAMRAGKKLITTNQNIVNYDFFLYGNIYVVDRKCPLVPDDFLDRQFQPYSPSILSYYSVEGWLAEILSL